MPLWHNINLICHRLCQCQASQWIGLPLFMHLMVMLRLTFPVSYLIFWLSLSPKTPLFGPSINYHVSCTTIIHHRPILICMPHLRFRQHSSSTCAQLNWRTKVECILSLPCTSLHSRRLFNLSRKLITGPHGHISVSP